MIVQRPELTLAEKAYLPSVLSGMVITIRHFFRNFWITWFGSKLEEKDRTLMDMSATRLTTMQYPEEKWPLPPKYRGAPTLIKDEDNRVKCVSCQLCEFVCPPRAITITPSEIPYDAPNAKVEKTPRAFEINMLRCIYCGLCEEVCPEEAIFLKNEYALIGTKREDLIHDKNRLLEMGGVDKLPIKKWEKK